MKVLDEREALARVGGDMDLLREIADLFQQECPQALENLRAAIERGDGPAAGREAHGLKGSASNFGAVPVVKAAIRIEQLAREGRMVETQPEYKLLNQHVETLIKELREL